MLANHSRSQQKKGDESYEFEATSTLLADGKIDFTSSLKHNNAIVLRPHVTLLDGESISFNNMDADAAHLVTLAITQKQVNEDLSPKAAQSAETKAAGDAAKPSEDLRYRKMKPPRYPPAAVRAHVQGEVMVNVLTDTSGMPTSAEVSAIEPASAIELGGAAVVAALQWRYKPGVRGGQLVGGAVLVPVSFFMKGDHGEQVPAEDPMRPLDLSYRKVIAPVYPAQAIAGRVAGKVFLIIEVGADGNVAGARVERVVPDTATGLGDAALAAVRTWQFSPQVVDGIARATQARVPIDFNLDDTIAAIDAAGPAKAATPIVLAPMTNILQTIVVTPSPRP